MRDNRTTGTRRLAARALAAAFALALTAAACSSKSSSGGSNPSQSPAPAASGSLQLKGVCPATVVVQSNWFPEAEHGAPYQLLGPGYTVDAAHKRISGPLVASGKDTGVRIEIRAGGPAVGFQSSAALMYQDPSITLGMVQSDEIVQLSKSQPVVGVVAPLELDPQIILWDPSSHPEWHTITDIGQTSTKVLYFQTGTYMQYLLGAGILRASQVDGSYDGSPSRFVASGGKIAVQGYATQEPYQYEHELRTWNKPVAFQLVSDTGYPNYANVLAVRADRTSQLSPCLQRLVPILQQAQVDFMRNPAGAIGAILKANDSYKGAFVYSKGNADWAVAEMRKLGIVDNGPDKTVGNFDLARIQKLIGIDTPIFNGQHKAIKPNLAPADVVTNQFIDPSIGLR